MGGTFESYNFKATAGEIIMILRTRRNMTKAELAKKVGVSPSMITRYEKGQSKMSAKIFDRMATALDVSMHDIMDLYDSDGGMNRIIAVWEGRASSDKE